jgi:hypothetical protein
MNLNTIAFQLSLLPASAGFLLSLIFDPKDGGEIFLLNVRLSPNYMALHPRRPYSSVTTMRTSNPI